MARKPILVVDWDGVVHEYKEGWKGPTVIESGPVPGAIAFLREAVQHFTVAIYSSRSGQPGGIAAMRVALGKWAAAENGWGHHWLDEIQWPTTKPPAFLQLDDRAMQFTGVFPSMEELANFKTWQGK